MTYSVEKLQSVAECDALLNEVAFEIRDLNYKYEGLDKQNDKIESTSGSRAALVAELQARLQVLDATIAVMPEGAEKEATIIKKKDAELRLLRLNQTNSSTGPVAFVRREGDVAMIEASLTVLNDFKQQLENRRQLIGWRHFNRL